MAQKKGLTTAFWPVVLAFMMCGFQESNGMVCPYEECTCSTLSNNLRSVQCDLQEDSTMPQLRSSYDYVDTMVVTNGRLQSLSKNDLPSGLSELTFHETTFVTFDDDAFDNSENTLSKLSLFYFNHDLTQLPVALSSLNALKELLIKVPSGFNWGLSNPVLQKIGQTVQILRMVSESEDSSFTEDHLSNFKVLADFSLTSHNIGRLNFADSVHTSLRRLDLHSLGERLPPPYLDKLININTLELGRFDLSGLQSNPGSFMVHSPQNIESLHIFDSPLQYDLSLKPLTKLKSFQCVRCSIEEVPRGLSDVKASLVNLDLSGNLITSVSRESFKDLTTLETLKLSVNKIRTVSNTAFEDLGSLLLLDLNHNELTRVPLALTYIPPTPHFVALMKNNPIRCQCTPERFFQWSGSISMDKEECTSENGRATLQQAFRSQSNKCDDDLF